jgi:hypothetical protein
MKNFENGCFSLLKDGSRFKWKFAKEFTNKYISGMVKAGFKSKLISLIIISLSLFSFCWGQEINGNIDTIRIGDKLMKRLITEDRSFQENSDSIKGCEIYKRANLTFFPEWIWVFDSGDLNFDMNKEPLNIRNGVTT